MGNFQRDDNRGGGFRGGNGGGRPSFGRGPVTMHKAVCDECHKNCEVPFRPSGDKPIYCNDCFSSKRGNEDRGPRRDFGDRGPKREFNNRPAQSSFNKPAPMQDDVKKQLEEINIKLDRLLSAIEKSTLPIIKKVETKTPVKKVVIKKKK